MAALGWLGYRSHGLLWRADSGDEEPPDGDESWGTHAAFKVEFTLASGPTSNDLEKD